MAYKFEKDAVAAFYEYDCESDVNENILALFQIRAKEILEDGNEELIAFATDANGVVFVDVSYITLPASYIAHFWLEWHPETGQHICTRVKMIRLSHPGYG